MLAVKFIVRLYSEQNISFPDGHYLETTDPPLARSEINAILRRTR